MKQNKRTRIIGIVMAVVIGLMTISSTNSHEYYVSVTRVEFVPEHKAVQIISQIFIDDFEDLIRKRYDDTVILDVKDESEKINGYMERYLKKKLRFQINDAAVDYVFLGKKYDDDIVYCYMEIEGISQINSMEIINDILYDLYEEQENIVRTKINSKNKSFILTSSKNKAVLNFN